MSSDDDQRDAARYRLLRSMHWSDSPLAIVVDPKKSLVLGSVCLSNDLLDQRVDQLLQLRTAAGEVR